MKFKKNIQFFAPAPTAISLYGFDGEIICWASADVTAVGFKVGSDGKTIEVITSVSDASYSFTDSTGVAVSSPYTLPYTIDGLSSTNGGTVSVGKGESTDTYAAATNAKFYAIPAEDALTTYDLRNLSLTVGSSYSITVKAKANGFTESNASSAVTFASKDTLTTPVLTNLSADGICKFSFPNDTRAYAYKIFVDGEQKAYPTYWSADLQDGIYTVTMSSACFPTVKTYSITAQAYSQDGDYFDSALSAPLSFTSLTQLAAPTIALNADGKTLEITDVENAASYDVYVDGTMKTNVQRVTGYTVTFASNFSSVASGGGEASSVTLTANTGASTPLTSAARGLVWQGVSTLAASSGVSNLIFYTDASGAKHTFYQYLTLTSDITITYADATCLTGDMLITLADGTTKRIDTITLADRVLAYNPETMALEADEIIRCDSDKIKTHSEYDVWTFSDGTIIKTVHRHRFYNVERNAMVYMDEWKIGEHAIKTDGTKVALVNHVNVQEEVRHYTIFTKNQNYFANGLLSGNRYTKPIVFANNGR